MQRYAPVRPLHSQQTLVHCGQTAAGWIRMLHLGHVTGSGGATFQTDPKKIERSCGPKCCVKDRSIKSKSVPGATTIVQRALGLRPG